MHDRAAFLPGPHHAFAITDVKGNGKVRDVYSDVPGGTPPCEHDLGDTGQGATEGLDYNREHSWPQSGFNGVSPPYSDPWSLHPGEGGAQLEAGLYFCRLVAGPANVTRRMVLAR